MVYFGGALALMNPLFSSHQSSPNLKEIDSKTLADKITSKQQDLILLDARFFHEYASSHICGSINVGGNESFRKKFVRTKSNILSFIDCLLGESVCSSVSSIILYDRDMKNIGDLQTEGFLSQLLQQILSTNKPIFVLNGGFVQFQAEYPELCQSGSSLASTKDLEFVLDSYLSAPTNSQKPTAKAQFSAPRRPSLSGMIPLLSSRPRPGINSPSQPSSDSCATLHNSARRSQTFSGAHGDLPGPSRILPHLLLGSQADATSRRVCLQYGVTHVVSVSVDGPTPSHIPAARFLRVPVNDNHTDRMRPYFERTFSFIDEARQAGGRVLVHCLAGISRSPALAMAYLMHSRRVSMREAYNLVKSIRTSIAPNFNFLGQLLDFERECVSQPTAVAQDRVSAKKRERPTYLGLDCARGQADSEGKRSRISLFPSTTAGLLPSPSTVLSRLELSSPVEPKSDLASSTRLSQSAPSVASCWLQPIVDWTKMRASSSADMIGCRKGVAVRNEGSTVQ